MDSDYDSNPERYRAGMRVTRAAVSGPSLYEHIARSLTGRVLDVGCADGPLSTVADAWVVGVDRSTTMLSAHPGPAVLADATALPFPDETFDAVVAVNMLYHLDDPRIAIAEAKRVLVSGGVFCAATPARSDSPELAEVWRPQPSTFDAEEAPDIVSSVFGAVEIERWDAPLVTLATPDAIRDYLIARHVTSEDAARAATRFTTPLVLTKRGAIVTAIR